MVLVVVPQSLWFLSLSFSVFVCTAAVVACKANWQADGFYVEFGEFVCSISLFLFSTLASNPDQSRSSLPLLHASSTVAQFLFSYSFPLFSSSSRSDR